MGLASVVAGVLLAADLGNMAVFSSLFGHFPWYSEEVWDALTVLVLVAPALHFFLFRPISRALAERDRAEAALRRSRDELEVRVAARTAELTAANEELRRSQEALQQVSMRLLTAQESERASIAERLQEGVAQTFTAIKWMVENALHQAEERSGAADAEVLRAIVPRMQEAVEEIRRLGVELRPPTLDELGLIATVGWVCRVFQESHPEIRAAKRIELDEEATPEPIKIVIYRILQEALENVAEHSHARGVEVCLRGGEGGIELTVADDGRGFAVEEASSSPREGIGLDSMRERARLSGGVLSVSSRPGAGTTVRAWWPGPSEE